MALQTAKIVQSVGLRCVRGYFFRCSSLNVSFLWVLGCCRCCRVVCHDTGSTYVSFLCFFHRCRGTFFLRLLLETLTRRFQLPFLIVTVSHVFLHIICLRKCRPFILSATNKGSNIGENLRKKCSNGWLWECAVSFRRTSTTQRFFFFRFVSTLVPIAADITVVPEDRVTTTFCHCMRSSYMWHFAHRKCEWRFF